MKRAIVAAVILVVSVGSGRAGTRADLSGDAVIDFVTTMDMPFVTVGNPGNAGELSGAGAGGWGCGPDRICGALDYVFRMGKFEVTAGQYTEFLNAVAATDTYGLYNTSMWSDTAGCKIARSGSPGSYTYSMAADWEDRPVNYVSWGDAARFANWLTNGMPTGGQDLTTTEDGSYFLNGATSTAELLAVARKAPEDGGRYYIPSEDEWYKAAYHKNDGATGNYFDYPTSSDSAPSTVLVDPDPGNNANFDGRGILLYCRTEVGEFENSESPYGMFDMGGNVFEWNEAILEGSWRGLRGGSFFYGGLRGLYASYREVCAAGGAWDTGFRVSEVPEPATLSLLALGGLAVMRRRRK